MNRKEITSMALKEVDNNKALILELATGTGKTKIAIECIRHICDKVFVEEESEATILIVVAKTIHKNEWLKEIKKWGGLPTSKILIECYESLKKHKGEFFDVVVLDEVQHLSETRMDILKSMYVNYNIIGLSATLPNKVRYFLTSNYKTGIVKHSLTEAIKSDILPDPTIYLIPLKFDSKISEVIIKNGNPKLPTKECNWHERWDYIKNKSYELHIKCTKAQYLEDLNSQIEWYKSIAMRGNKRMERIWLQLCNKRLKWLSLQKNEYLLPLLDYLKNYRTLTFCSSIEQAEKLGKNCIHSKNKKSTELLENFNNKKIKHITSVGILNEGANLTDCRVGILANLNASEIITVQRFGRILRHKHPIIVIPYYPNTREEELIKKHLEGYNKELIKTIYNTYEIKL